MDGYFGELFGLFLEKNQSTNEVGNLQYVHLYMQRVLAPVFLATHVMCNKSLFSTIVNHCDVMKVKASLRIMIDGENWNGISFWSSRVDLTVEEKTLSKTNFEDHFRCFESEVFQPTNTLEEKNWSTNEVRNLQYVLFYMQRLYSSIGRG